MADYNINAVTRRVVFTGSAGLGPYSFTFEVLDQNDLAVYFNATKLTLTTDYTVTVNANGTGSVTIVTGTNVPTTPIASDQIVIVGARDIERTTDFVTAGDLRASALNEQLDGQIIMIQQIAEENKRGMRAPVYDPALVEDGGVVDMELPTKASRAGKTLAFDSDGNPIVGEDIGNWRGDWAASVAYDVRDIVKDSVNSSIYRCNTAHTSSGTAPISGNADVAKWDLVIDATAVADAEAAQAAAEAAQAAAETAETNAATSETNAAASASSASTSATNAATSETNAATSATSASSSATSATASATAASASETAAATSETNAATSATSAATSATNASTSETNAAASASSASTSATNAATSETNAASSATNAATSATNAATAQTAAEAARDAIQQFYLGAQSSNPTVDGNGDPVTAGDWYFNTTDNTTRIYDGSAWNTVSPDLVGDTTPQLGGNLDTNGNDINFGDNDKANFGAGSDLQIYHDGSNSIITDTGTGDLLVGGNKIKLTDSSGAITYAEGAAGSQAVTLFHTSSAKLATTSTGVTITGTAIATTDTDTTNTGNITLDFGANQNFVLTLTGNVTLDNPTTEQVGQSGFIVFIQDATGGRTVSLGTDYETAGGAGITLSSAASATDIVPYVVVASGRILLGAPQLAFA